MIRPLQTPVSHFPSQIPASRSFLSAGKAFGPRLECEVSIDRTCQRGHLLLFQAKHLSNVWSPLGNVFISPSMGQPGPPSPWAHLCLCPALEAHPPHPSAASLLQAGTTETAGMRLSPRPPAPRASRWRAEKRLESGARNPAPGSPRRRVSPLFSHQHTRASPRLHPRIISAVHGASCRLHETTLKKISVSCNEEIFCRLVCRMLAW